MTISRIGWVVATLVVGSVSVASANDVFCPPSVGNITVDNVVVVPGPRCTLNSTDVTGSVEVQAGGDLRMINGATAGGNVEADAAERVVLNGVQVGGNVQIQATTGVSSIAGSLVGGSLQFDQNTGAVTVNANNVTGDVQLDDNAGGITVRRNVIGGNLQCQGNAAPVLVRANSVEGVTECQ